MNINMCPPATDPFILREQAEAARLDAPRDVWAAFRSHFNSSKRRGIPFLFTFEQWWDWWRIDNRWDLRGVGKDALVMSRPNDEGPYSPGNVFVSTHQDNCANRGEKSREIARAKIQESWDSGRVSHLTGKRETHPRSRAVITPKGRFGNAALAAEAYGLTRQMAAKRARDHMSGFWYESDCAAG